MSKLITILHRGCSQPAFLYDHHPAAGEKVLSVHAYHLNGDPVGHLAPMGYCESCGLRIRGAQDLAPDLKVYDMTSPEDMRKLYEGVTDQENLP